MVLCTKRFKRRLVRQYKAVSHRYIHICHESILFWCIYDVTDSYWNWWFARHTNERLGLYPSTSPGTPVEVRAWFAILTHCNSRISFCVSLAPCRQRSAKARFFNAQVSLISWYSEEIDFVVATKDCLHSAVLWLPWKIVYMVLFCGCHGRLSVHGAVLWLPWKIVYIMLFCGCHGRLST